MAIADFETRRATPSDASDIADAHRDSIASIGPRYYPAHVVKDWGEGLTSDVYVNAMAGGEVFFIALGEVDGQRAVLGFASHRLDGDRHGTSVYVRGAAARRGIGSILYRLAEADAITSGAETIHVEASLAGRAFAIIAGWRPSPRSPHQPDSPRKRFGSS